MNLTLDLTLLQKPAQFSEEQQAPPGRPVADGLKTFAQHSCAGFEPASAEPVEPARSAEPDWPQPGNGFSAESPLESFQLSRYSSG